MATILIVHRADDADAESGRLCDSLDRALLHTEMATNIEALAAQPNGGQALRDLVGAASLVVAVIGRSWLTLRDPQQRRRLDDPDDIVRCALERAFDARVPVVPVLVQSAQLPSAADLPASLTRLSKASSIQLRHVRWGDDVAQLIDRIEVSSGEQTPGRAPGSEASPTSMERWRAFTGRAAARLNALRRRAARRSRHWQAIKRAATAALIVPTAVSVYSAYRYVAAADVRRVQKIAAEVTSDMPVETASARLRELRDLVAGANDGAVTNAAVDTLKALAVAQSKTSADARRLRREAMEMLKAIRGNDLSSVFANGELAKSDFLRVDLSSVVLRRVSLESAWLMGVKFMDADLSGTDLSGAYIRGADFARANLSGADVGELDWYNARGFTEAQLRTVQLETIERCPLDASSAHSIGALQAKLVTDYSAPWEKFAERDRAVLTTLWQEYAKPGGLCDVVDRWPK